VMRLRTGIALYQQACGCFFCALCASQYCLLCGWKLHIVAALQSSLVPLRTIIARPGQSLSGLLSTDPGLRLGVNYFHVNIEVLYCVEQVQWRVTCSLASI